MPVIICSTQCVASQNIKEWLIAKHGFIPGEHEKFKVWGKGEHLLVEVPDKLVQADYLDNYFATDFYVFASKHKSESGKPTLTVHTCGNWGPGAEVGGRPRELAYSAPIPKKVAFQSLASRPLEGFEATMECTHHGPTNMKTPFFFIEIGSTEKEWANKKAGEIVADAIMKSIEPKLPEFRVAIGAGGTHYCPSFTKLELTSDLAFAHIIPNYAVDSLEEETFQQAVEKSGTKLLVLDWKGLKGSQREKITGFAKNSGLEITSDKEIRKS